MFLKYEIKNDVLYLYIDDMYEFASYYKTEKESMIDKIKKFIKDSKIKFNGTKVVLIVSGILIGSLTLNNINKEEKYSAHSDVKYVNKIILDSKKDFLNNTKSEEKVINISNEANYKNTNYEEKTLEKKQTIAQNAKTKQNSNVSVNENVVNNSSVEENKGEVNTQNKEKTISVLRSTGSIQNIYFNEYLIGVVAGEMPASFEMEALKAQAVAARTYVNKLLDRNKVITDNVITQVYKDDNELKVMWGSSYDYYYNKIKTAVYDTSDITIKYNGQLIDAVYHSMSNGYTEDSVNVWNNNYPYLKSVSSPYETSLSNFSQDKTFSYEELSNILNDNINSNSQINVLSRNESNRVSSVKINDKVYTGVELRTLLSLRSSDFDITRNDSNVVFTTRGYGHGVGMSQYGANMLAKQGYNYVQILNYYYTNVVVN